MSGWVKIDNNMPEALEGKLIQRGLPPLSDRAFRLYISSMCFASRALSDGLIPAAKAKTLTATANKRAVAELVAAGLYETTESGDYVVHDYLAFNPSRIEVKEMQDEARERREANRERVSRYRARQRGTPAEIEVQMLARDEGICLQCGATEDLVMDHIKPLAAGGTTELDNVQTLCRGCNSRKRRRTTDYRKRPGVTAAVTGYTAVTEPGSVTEHDHGDPRARDRSDPLRIGLRGNDQGEEDVETNDKDKPTDSELQRATPEQLLIVDTLASQIRQRDPKAKVNPRGERWLREARLLIEADGRDPDEIMAVLNWLPTHQSGDFAWGAVILSMGKLREQFSKLITAMGASRPAKSSVGTTTDFETKNKAWAAWMREHLPDITWGPEHGILHQGAWRVLCHLSLAPEQLSVAEHGDMIRRSVEAYNRDWGEDRAA